MEHNRLTVKASRKDDEDGKAKDMDKAKRKVAATAIRPICLNEVS